MNKKKEIKRLFELDGYSNDICETAANLCVDHNISFGVISNLLKKVEKESKGEDGPEIVYLCDGKSCPGDHCESVICSHTHDIRHAVNFECVDEKENRWMEKSRHDEKTVKQPTTYLTREEWVKRFAKRVRIKLAELDMGQKDLARKAYLTESSVSRYLSGDRIPNGSILVNIASALECSVDDLIGEEFYLCGVLQH